MSIEADRQRAALHRIAADDPELAARLVLMMLPAAASKIRGGLSFELEVEGMGTHRVGVGPPDFRLQADAKTLVELVTGTAGPLGLMMRGRLRIRGKRRKAMKLRRMSGEVSMADVVEAGGTPEPDILYRSLPYIVDPEWTTGHDFTVRYVVTGDGGGTWYVTVRDGQPLEVSREERDVAGSATVSFDSYQRIASGQLSPSQAMQNQLTKVDGEIYPITLMGRWIARAQCADDAELKREEEQR